VVPESPRVAMVSNVAWMSCSRRAVWFFGLPIGRDATWDPAAGS
jgi:hypothetical protein